MIQWNGVDCCCNLSKSIVFSIRSSLFALLCSNSTLSCVRVAAYRLIPCKPFCFGLIDFLGL
jgi:hypothetical protein